MGPLGDGGHTIRMVGFPQGEDDAPREQRVRGRAR